MGVEDYDVELYEAVEDLVAEGYLEKGSAALGVARKVIHEGYDSMTLNQRAIYNAVVAPALKKRGAELAAIRAQNSAPD